MVTLLHTCSMGEEVRPAFQGHLEEERMPDFSGGFVVCSSGRQTLCSPPGTRKN